MGSWFSAQKMVGYGVAAIAAVLVLYPVYFLLQAAFDVGDPQVRPPTAYGVDNFSGLLQYPQIMLNTPNNITNTEALGRVLYTKHQAIETSVTRGELDVGADYNRNRDAMIGTSQSRLLPPSECSI